MRLLNCHCLATQWNITACCMSQFAICVIIGICLDNSYVTLKVNRERNIAIVLSENRVNSMSDTLNEFALTYWHSCYTHVRYHYVVTWMSPENLCAAIQNATNRFHILDRVGVAWYLHMWYRTDNKNVLRTKFYHHKNIERKRKNKSSKAPTSQSDEAFFHAYLLAGWLKWCLHSLTV